ncbi:MAG: hypothetical protein JRC87_08290 [Deltaproteobacteria bacterium]|nr:hypothetical protein [Deltaproteobacteria bacterium]
MQKNTNVKTDHEIISRKSKASPEKKYDSKSMSDGQVGSRGDSNRLMALEDVLQDPMMNREGF